MAARCLAKLCYDTLMCDGRAARQAVEHHVVTPALERVVEANVLLSGLGFESGGLATAHSVALALPSLPACKGRMHGEMVAFGIVTQLVLDEDTRTEVRDEVLTFLLDVGLPVTLTDLGVEHLSGECLRALALAAAGPGTLCHSHPFPVTPESMADAIVAADALGRAFKSRGGQTRR